MLGKIAACLKAVRENMAVSPSTNGVPLKGLVNFKLLLLFILTAFNSRKHLSGRLVRLKRSIMKVILRKKSLNSIPAEEAYSAKAKKE